MLRTSELTEPVALEGFRVFTPVVAGLIAFIIFWFTQRSEKLKQKFIERSGEIMGPARFIMFSRYLGGLVMGILPLLAFLLFYPSTSLSELGLLPRPDKLAETAVWTAVLWAVIIPLFHFTARKPKTMEDYPQIRVELWNRKLVNGSLLSWAVYLLGYEMLFRGVLLFPLVDAVGVWAAIGINVGMYSATHIPKGAGETIGAIPLSIVLCLLCISTGSFWIAFLVHIAMAWTTMLTALRYHPDMRISKTNMP